jgi:hypothetical protein
LKNDSRTVVVGIRGAKNNIVIVLVIFDYGNIFFKNLKATIIVLQYPRSKIYCIAISKSVQQYNIVAGQQYIVLYNNILSTILLFPQAVKQYIASALLLGRTRREMYTKTCRYYQEGQKAMTDDTITEKRRIK